MSKKIVTLCVFSLLSSMCYAETDEVLVKVAGLAITKQMLRDEINSNSKERKEYLLSNPNQLNEYIDIFYREKLFEQLAIQQKVDQTPEFKALVKSTNRRLLVNRFVEDKKKNIKVPDLEKSAKEFYAVNKSQFNIGEQVEARHILLKSAPNDENRDLVRQRLTDILNKIKKDPTQFEALAKKHSEDPGSAKNGGALGKFVKGRMVPEFDKQAFQLSEPGQLSEVFSTKFGFHIIQLIKKHPATIASFEQVKNNILAKLRKDYVDAEYMQWRNNIVNPDKAEVNEVKLQDFVKELISQEK